MQYLLLLVLAQNKFELWIVNESDLEGLTDTSIDAAKVAAIKKGKEQEWLFTLQFPSYIPFLTYSRPFARV